MKGLLDFLQSASNSVAGNVAGPVDLIGMGLNKIGVPVGPAPVGGSEWMKRKGLLRDVEQGPARIAGETFGLLGPAMATQFAPQIAKGLLQGADNLAAPRTLNPQAGAIVWHGSPHKFDKFDSSKIGTGEGAQAYGHGLYLAESPGVAKSYQEALSAPALTVRGREVRTSAGTNMDTAKAWLDDVYERGFFNSATANPFDQAIKDVRSAPVPDKDGVIAALEKLKQANASMSQGGNLYKVDLPDDQIAKMLDWDTNLGGQSPLVKDAVHRVGRSPDSYGLDRVADDMRMVEMQKLFQSREGVEALRKAGVPGIRYLDGSSRVGGKGTSNFVIFPGNEGLLSILERNGKPLK